MKIQVIPHNYWGHWINRASCGYIKCIYVFNITYSTQEIMDKRYYVLGITILNFDLHIHLITKV